MSVEFKKLNNELKNIFPGLETNLSPEKITIPHFGIENLRVEIDNRLIFRLYKTSLIKPKDLAIYLESKIDFETISKRYLKEDSFYLYPGDSFSNTPTGLVEKRMCILRILKKTDKALAELKNELNSEKVK